MNDLHDALRQRAESAPLRSADLGTIQLRARSIRRRRAAVAVGGSVAAVAVIAGLGFALAPNGADHAVPPVASTTAVPTPTPTSSGTPNGGEHQRVETGRVFPVSTNNLSADGTTGGEMGVPFWWDGELNAPDGSQTPLKDRPTTFALLPDGSWLATVETDGNTRLVHLSAAGLLIGAPEASVPEGLAAASGHVAAISIHDGGWALRINGHSFDLQSVTPSARVDGFAANGDIYFTLGDGIERLAHVADGTIDKLGRTERVVTSPDGQDAVPQADGTWLVEAANGGDEWTIDWAGVNSFSPDGKYVALVGDPQHLVPGSQDWDSDGATGTLWIRGASDNSPVAVFTAPKDGFFGPWTWEGDDILALVFERDSASSQTGTWTLVRLSADGYKVVRSTGWPGRIDTPPYVFGAGVTSAP